ncbi:MAG: MarR family transcriptional regulator [Actinomycetota bacterium]|nr:MarR family transcriptional regulator [Actinomycetota bacterium]
MKNESDPDHDAVLDAIVAGSRVLVGISTRSLQATAHDVTLPQCRALATLGQRGPLSLVGLAEALQVNPSTATRMCERLIEKGLVQRARAERGVSLDLSEVGKRVVLDITRARRRELDQIVSKLSRRERDELVRCMDAFRRAAGEPGERDWAIGWWD